ncbi:hypothetical protein [Prevotella sp.]|uniref:hypothetical protein n=1 Tax=Prevotella sp. TaxID=59823 RepID=UPI003AB1C719
MEKMVLLAVMGLCQLGIGNGQATGRPEVPGIVRMADDTLTRCDDGASCGREEKACCKNPLRAAKDGFEWREMKGAGLKLMALKGDKMRLLADPQLTGVVMVRDGDERPHKVIQVIDLAGGSMDDVAGAIGKADGTGRGVRLEMTEPGRDGVKRYAVVDGEKDGCMTGCEGNGKCGGCTAGKRYVLVYDAHPDKALLIETGDEEPLFDEASIELCDDSPDALSRDVLYTMTGELSIAPETYSFRPDGSDEEYWIVDKTGRLEAMYDEATGGRKDGTPIKVTLRLEYNGKWDTGFAELYDGVFLVREIIK